MNAILNFVRDYFVFLLVLFLFSYLTPREDYRKYFQFFIGALMVAILMRPVFSFFAGDGEARVRTEIESIFRDIENLEYSGEGEDIFEWFLEHKGVIEENTGEP